MERYCLVMLCFIIAWMGGHTQGARIVFYNVENYFDVEDDTLTEDDEFLPDSNRFWTYERYQRKAVRIYQVLSAIDGWDMPAIAGLCEVENRRVLEKLVYDTPLSRYSYRIIHKDSPDPRGIDVAMIYREGIFQPDSVEWLKVSLPGASRTRDILKVTGRLWGEEEICIYINHWPSRSGGSISSAPKRMSAALTLERSLDEMFSMDPGCNVVIMGDFNDEPGDESLRQLAGKVEDGDSLFLNKMVNLSEKIGWANDFGTIKHQGVWSVFDQFLVSGTVNSGKYGIRLPVGHSEIFSAPFLLEPDPGYAGYRPFRTYIGPNYHNGFSDHLPVSIVIEKARQ